MHQYAGNPASFPANVGIIDDADLNPATASALDVAPTNLADRTAWLKAHVGAAFLVNEQQVIVSGDAGPLQVLDSPDLSILGTIYVPFAQVGFGSLGGGIATVTNTTPPVVGFNSAHGLHGNPLIYLSEITGGDLPGALTGYWQAAVVDATHISLIGATASGVSTLGGCASLPFQAAFGGHQPFDEWVFTLDGNFVLSAAASNNRLCLFASTIPATPPGQVSAQGQPGGNLTPTQLVGAKGFNLGSGFGTAGPVSLRARYVGGNVAGGVVVGIGVLVPANPGSHISAAAAWGDLVITAQQVRSS